MGDRQPRSQDSANTETSRDQMDEENGGEAGSDIVTPQDGYDPWPHMVGAWVHEGLKLQLSIEPLEGLENTYHIQLDYRGLESQGAELFRGERQANIADMNLSEAFSLEVISMPQSQSPDDESSTDPEVSELYLFIFAPKADSTELRIEIRERLREGTVSRKELVLKRRPAESEAADEGKLQSEDK